MRLHNRSLPRGPVPPWLPDWRDNEAYEPHGERPLWAAAFLSRNPDYIADYTAFRAVPAFFPEGGKTPKFSGRSFAPWSGMEYYFADPPPLPGETLEEYERRNARREKPYTVTNLESGLAKKWGVDYLFEPGADWISPSRDASVHPFFSSSQRVYVRHDHAPAHWTGPAMKGPEFRALAAIHYSDPDDHPNVTAVWFDLDDNLERQMNEALEFLRGEKAEQAAMDAEFSVRDVRKNAGGPQLASLPVALRVFDAVWRGAKREDIERVVFPKLGREFQEEARRKAYGRTLKLARELVSYRYRELLLRA